MMEAAYNYQRDLVKGVFPELATARRVLHFANPMRAATLVQSEIEEQENEESKILLPAIQLAPPSLQREKTGGPKRNWRATVAIVTPYADQLMPLTDKLLAQVDSTARNPKPGDEPETEYQEGAGFFVSIVRFRFRH